MAKKKHIEQEMEELNLTPFLDMMVVLIPFLMLTASFFSVVVIEAKLPTPIKDLPPPEKMLPPPFDLVVQVPPDSIKIFVNNKDPMGPPQFAVETKDSVYTEEQMDQFYSIIAGIKRQFPGEERVALDPHPAVGLEKIAKIIDLLRSVNPEDSVTVKAIPDRKMFTNVALKGVYVP